MSTPYRLEDGRWIDLESIVMIDQELNRAIPSQVTIRMWDGIEVRITGTEDEVTGYRDKIATAWVESSKKGGS